MAQKYTIWKALIQTSNKGFTLIELLIGLLITGIIGGLAMDAFISSSKMFGNDQRNIDNSQNLSAILGIIGNDIQQSGEQITEGAFPVVKFQSIPTTGNVQILGAPTGTYYMPGSSTITIRRALVLALPLCQAVAVGATPTTLVVADSDTNITSANPVCKPGTPSINTLAPAIPPAAAVALTTPISRPQALMDARNYRCKLDNLNADYTAANTDFCNPSPPSPSLETVRAAISDGSGNIRTFNYTNDNLDTTPTAPSTTASTNKFNITIGTGSLSASTPVDNGYAVSTQTSIYLIEERIYTLDNAGNLNMQKDGGSPGTLIKGIQTFNVSAKVYTNTTDKILDPIDGTTTAIPASRRCDLTVPNYICDFKSSNSSDNWKTLAGVKVDLQAVYDSTGRGKFTAAQLKDPNATDPNILKLRARAEFFPRNVLSK